MNNYRTNQQAFEAQKHVAKVFGAPSLPEVTELHGQQAKDAWDAWAPTFPAPLLELVPIEKDAFSVKLDRAGFSSSRFDPTKGVK